MKQISEHKSLLLGIFAAFLTIAAMTLFYAPSTWADEPSSTQVK